jgi:hypothetical protein
MSHTQDVHWVGSAWLKASIAAQTQESPSETAVTQAMLLATNPPEMTTMMAVTASREDVDEGEDGGEDEDDEGQDGDQNGDGEGADGDQDGDDEGPDSEALLRV